MDKVSATPLVELLVIERHDEGLSRASFVVRCHAGTLRLGQTLDTKVDPRGVATMVSLKCIAINLSANLTADELETNWAGLIALDGEGVTDIDKDWILRRS